MVEERVLVRVQAGAGVLFSLFLAVHLVNTMTAVGGAEAYDGFQAQARAVYQSPVFEIGLVLSPLLVHLAVSVWRIVRRRKRASAAGAGGVVPLRMRLHRYSGWFLLAVIVGHVSATRGTGFAMDAPAGFGALNFTTVVLPFIFIPYYMLLGVSGLFHMASGLEIAGRVFGVRVPAVLARGPGAWVPLALGSAAIVIGVLAMSGAFFEVPRESWGRFAQVAAEWTGIDLDAY